MPRDFRRLNRAFLGGSGGGGPPLEGGDVRLQLLSETADEDEEPDTTTRQRERQQTTTTDTEPADEELTAFERDLIRATAQEPTREPAPDDEPAQQGTSIDDLVNQADPQTFDRTFLLDKDVVPVDTGDEFPVPFPWEGIPRLAFVVNLNYAWDEANEEWVRQNPFSGGGGGTLQNAFFANQTGSGQNIPSGFGNTTRVELDDSGTRGYDPDGVFDAANNEFVAPADGTYHFDYSLGYDQYTTGNLYRAFLFTTGGETNALQVHNPSGSPATVSASVNVELDQGENIALLTNHESPNSEVLFASGACIYLSGYRVD